MRGVKSLITLFVSYPIVFVFLFRGFTPVDPCIWPSKSRATSSNLHTAAL